MAAVRLAFVTAVDRSARRTLIDDASEDICCDKAVVTVVVVPSAMLVASKSPCKLAWSVMARSTQRQVSRSRQGDVRAAPLVRVKVKITVKNAVEVL